MAIKNGHTFMVKYFFETATSGVYGLYTYESTTDGDEDCAKVYYRNYADVCNAYSLYTY